MMKISQLVKNLSYKKNCDIWVSSWLSQFKSPPEHQVCVLTWTSQIQAITISLYPWLIYQSVLLIFLPYSVELGSNKKYNI